VPRLRLVARSTAVLLLAALAAPAAWTAATGDVVLTVTGGSMRPTYAAGDVLLVRAPDGDELARVGTVVVAALGDRRYVHRVVEPTADGAWLQGDANPDRDPRPATPDAVLGTPRLHLGGGAAATWRWGQSAGGRVLLAGAALTLLLMPGGTRRPGARRPAGRPATGGRHRAAHARARRIDREEVQVP